MPMAKIRMIFFLFTLFTVVAESGNAQPPVFNTTADKDSILIGEQIQLVVSVTAPETFINQYKWASLPDTLNHFEVVNRSDVSRTTSGGMVTVAQKILITSFDSGQWILPTITANGISNTGGRAIKVNTVQVTALDEYRDIHDIADASKPFNYRPWLIGAAMAVTTALLIWLAIMLIKKQPVRVRQTGPVISPLDEALQELDKLHQTQWPEAQEYKKFHDRLDEIFRGFLHRQYHTHSPYNTNEEVLLQLKQTKMAGGYTTEIAQALRLNNFVKFAGYAPGVQQSYECAATIKRAILSVKTEINQDHAV
jgi:hypothetical protein